VGGRNLPDQCQTASYAPGVGENLTGQRGRGCYASATTEAAHCQQRVDCRRGSSVRPACVRACVTTAGRAAMQLLYPRDSMSGVELPRPLLAN